MKRIHSIDFTRGLVMIIMALDHVRDMMHIDAMTQSPTNLATTTPALFFTRWITYLCAPIFVFLAGTSAYLSLQKVNDISQSRHFLFKRGLWLILLEFTLVNFGLFFDLGFHSFIFEVIAAIGVGFIILGLLLKASAKIISAIGLLIIFCHDLLPLIPFSEGSVIKAILSPLFSPGAFPLTPRTIFITGYPPIPWLGILLIGLASGKLFALPVEKRIKLFVEIGVFALTLFIALRFINLYGDPVSWSSQKNSIYTFLSFMNITKYPPSLLFTLVTLGIMLLVLAATENVRGRSMQIVTTYGKVPLFYFLVHFYLIHLSMIVLMFIQGFNWDQLDFASGNMGRPKGITSGISLAVVYVVWISVVIILYKPCVWYGRYKSTHNNWWLKYL